MTPKIDELYPEQQRYTIIVASESKLDRTIFDSENCNKNVKFHFGTDMTMEDSTALRCGSFSEKTSKKAL